MNDIVIMTNPVIDRGLGSDVHLTSSSQSQFPKVKCNLSFCDDFSQTDYNYIEQCSMYKCPQPIVKCFTVAFIAPPVGKKEGLCL